MLALLLCALLIAAQPLQLTRQLFHFVSQRTLPRSTARCALLGCRLSALPLGLLQLSLGEFLEALGHFVHFLVAAATRTALLLVGALLQLVLIGETVSLKFEQVRQVLGHLSATAAPAAATLLLLPLAHFHLVGRLGILQMLEGRLFRCQRLFGLLGSQFPLSERHRLRGLLERLRDRLKTRIATKALRHLLDEPGYLFAQLRLREGDNDGIFLELLRGGLGLVAIEIKRRRHNLALFLRQGAGAFLSAAAAASAAPAAAFGRLAGLERLLERSNLHKVNIARRLLATGHGVVVRHRGVVRHRIPHLDVQLFEIHGVRRRHFRTRRRSAAVDAHAFLFAAIHGIHKVERLHAVIVIGLCFEKHFLDGRGRRISSRLHELDGRRHVFNDVNGVGRGCADRLTIGSLELNPVKALLVHDKAAGQRPIWLKGQRQ